jgi:hypothetical protein
MRPSITRELLLPKPAGAVREQSLKNHLSLVALRGGHASVDVIARLFGAIGTARALHEVVSGREATEQRGFDQAWEALIACAMSTRNGPGKLPADADFALLERLVSLHDEHMTVTPRHLLLAARAQFNRSHRGLVVQNALASDAASAAVAADSSGGCVQ